MSETRFSVIVPAYNGTGVLEKSLSALRDSDLSRKYWELIVVDDASTDDTGTLAAQYADRVVRLDGLPHGPSYARNRAAEVAKGDVAVFVDADVVVHKSTLRQFHEVLGELIHQFEATVGHFAGDGLMVFFNDPIPCEAPAMRAVEMAVAMREPMATSSPSRCNGYCAGGFCIFAIMCKRNNKAPSLIRGKPGPKRPLKPNFSCSLVT